MTLVLPTIDDWLLERFRNTFTTDSKLHFEASMYGAINLYLYKLFVGDNFMIKPQAVLRPEHEFTLLHDSDPDYEESQDEQAADHGAIIIQGETRIEGADIDIGGPGDDDLDSVIDPKDQSDGLTVNWSDKADLGSSMHGSMYSTEVKDQSNRSSNASDEADCNQSDSASDEIQGFEPWDMSVDSYGGQPSSRSFKSNLKKYFYPDFIVVKATGSLYNDTMLLIVEVKNSKAAEDKSQAQIVNYLRTAFFKRLRDPSLAGLLITGEKTELYRIVESGTSAKVVYQGTYQTIGLELRRHIYEIAKRWS